MGSLLWFTVIWHTRTGTVVQKKRAGCHFTMQAQGAFGFNNLCLPFMAFCQEFWWTARGGLLPLSQNGTPNWVLFTVLVRGDHQPVI